MMCNTSTIWRLENNRISQIRSQRDFRNNDVCDFVYEANGRLLESIDNGYYTDRSQFVWDGSRIAEVKTDELETDELENGELDPSSNVSMKMTYGGQVCQGYFPVFGELPEEGEEIFYAHPELAGVRSNQLPGAIQTKSGFGLDFSSKLSYTYGNVGYVTGCTVDNLGEKTVYSFTWQ